MPWTMAICVLPLTLILHIRFASNIARHVHTACETHILTFAKYPIQSFSINQNKLHINATNKTEKNSTKSMGYCTSTSEIYINCARAGMRAPTLVLTFHIQFNVNRQRFGYIRFMYSHTSNRFTMSVSAGCYLYGRYGRPCSIAARFAFIDLCMYRL